MVLTIKRKSRRRTLRRTNKQSGKTTVAVDKGRKAMYPGLRRSKTGKIYWETRKNRSDMKGSKV